MPIAVIRESDCVGCSKCIPACPVDAIIGAPQFLHSVLTQECIGCGLCVAPCPMDCIEMLEVSLSEEKAKRAERAKARYQARMKRLLAQQQKELLAPVDLQERNKIREEIKAAVERTQKKREKHGS